MFKMLLQTSMKVIASGLLYRRLEIIVLLCVNSCCQKDVGSYSVGSFAVCM